MDSLDDLPEGNASLSPQEEEIMNQFGMRASSAPQQTPPPVPDQKPTESPKSAEKKKGWFGSSSETGNKKSNKLKIVGIATVLFLALSVPFVDGLFGAIPYANTIPVWILKTVLFALAIALVVWFS